MGLLQRSFHDLLGDPLDLDVHLQRGDAFGGPRNLEVHIAEVILIAEDIRENGVSIAFLHEAHGHTGNRCFDRHTGIHQRQRGSADAGHRA